MLTHEHMPSLISSNVLDLSPAPPYQRQKRASFWNSTTPLAHLLCGYRHALHLKWVLAATGTRVNSRLNLSHFISQGKQALSLLNRLRFVPHSGQLSHLLIRITGVKYWVTANLFFLEAVAEIILHSQHHQICSSPLTDGLMFSFSVLLLLMYL